MPDEETVLFSQSLISQTQGLDICDRKSSSSSQNHQLFSLGFKGLKKKKKIEIR